MSSRLSTCQRWISQAKEKGVNPSLSFFFCHEPYRATHVRPNLVCIFFAGAADPYVKMTLGEHQRVSKTVKNTMSPVWDEHFEFQLDAACDELLFTVCELDTRAVGQ